MGKRHCVNWGWGVNSPQPPPGGRFSSLSAHTCAQRRLLVAPSTKVPLFCERKLSLRQRPGAQVNAGAWVNAVVQNDRKCLRRTAPKMKFIPVLHIDSRAPTWSKNPDSGLFLHPSRRASIPLGGTTDMCKSIQKHQLGSAWWCPKPGIFLTLQGPPKYPPPTIRF